MTLRLALALFLLPAPALADDLFFFHSPSGNIHCMIATGEWAEARCDIFEMTTKLPPAPADCDLDYGHAFAIGPQDMRGMRVCAGDSVATPDGLVLDYGKSVDLGGFRCTSETSGMTCTNPSGHGFKLSKARQDLF